MFDQWSYTHISEASEWQCLKEIVGIIKSSKDGVPFLKQVQNIVTFTTKQIRVLWELKMNV